jgi:four helix bundle protein
MEKIQKYTDLNTWKYSHLLVLDIYKISEKFPDIEKFGLTNQIRRASVSITSNIAEGFGRNSANDKRQFYAIAKGSLFEVHNQLLIARDLQFISIIDFDKFDSRIEVISKLLSGIINKAPSRIITK